MQRLTYIAAVMMAATNAMKIHQYNDAITELSTVQYNWACEDDCNSLNYPNADYPNVQTCIVWC